jgi:hypothetical protein
MNRHDQIKKIFKIHKTVGQEYFRVGSVNDGGYVLANDLTKKDFVMSCGIGDNVIWDVSDIAFEYQIVESVVGLDMYEYALDSLSNMPKNSRFFKAEIGKDTLIKDMLSNAGNQEDYVLKMDIEGSEWDFFNDASSEDINNFRQIVVEFHWLESMVNNDSEYEKIINTFLKINKTHNLVLLNGNNYSTVFEYESLLIPNVIEVLFLRKDSYAFIKEGLQETPDCPEKLITPCNPNQPQLEFSI